MEKYDTYDYIVAILFCGGFFYYYFLGDNNPSWYSFMQFIVICFAIVGFNTVSHNVRKYFRDKRQAG